MKAKPFIRDLRFIRGAVILYAFVFSRAATLTSLSSSLVHAAVAATRCGNLQVAHANARVPVVVSSRRPQTPSPQDVACPVEKSTQSRLADIKETFYEREVQNDVYMRRLSDFYERRSDIASAILTRYIALYRVGNLTLGTK